MSVASASQAHMETRMKQMIRSVEASIAPKAESSVEIATDAKGAAKLTVKVYSEKAGEALEQALELYKLGIAALKEWQAV
jgi:hypothetical protein